MGFKMHDLYSFEKEILKGVKDDAEFDISAYFAFAKN